MESAHETVPAGVIEAACSPSAPRRRWLVPLIVLSGIVLGSAISIVSLLLYDHYRHQRWEQGRLESLADLDRRGQAAKEREDFQLPGDHLSRFNEQFREIYRIVRAEALGHASPIIVTSGDELIFVRNGDRKTVTYLPPIYHQLKAYSHVALAAYLVTGLDPGNTELPATRQIELKRLLERMPDLQEELKKRDYPDDLKSRQKAILDAASEFLESCHRRAYDKQPINADERTAFAKRIQPLLEANLADAARVQIEALEHHVSRWCLNLPPDELRRIKVVVMGGPMPRRDNVAVQFFEWYLGREYEDWIIYAESLFDEQRALGLLATHIVDRDVGKAFFDESSRMTRDLLGDAASRILAGRKRSSN
jgi:predicted HicB family RNase H-like nuclease